MFKAIKAASIILVSLVVLTVSVSCTTTPAPTLNPTTTPTSTPNPAQLITVTYSSAITYQITPRGTVPVDHPRTGYVYLIVNMAIKIQGYESTNISRSGFYAVVNSVKYTMAPVTGDLEYPCPIEMDTFAGGVSITTCNAAFEVPQGTTAFSMGYEGAGNYNMQWVPWSQTSAANTTQFINVSYTSTIASQIGTGNLADHPEAGYVYLIVNMSIQNNGYESFEVYPWTDLFVVVDGVAYFHAIVKQLGNQLPGILKVIDDGTLTGNLAFEVPEGATTFSMRYEGFSDYNMRCVQH